MLGTTMEIQLKSHQTLYNVFIPGDHYMHMVALIIYDHVL